MPRFLGPAVALVVTLLATGCEQPPQVVGGKARPAGEVVKSAVSLSPSTTEIVGSLNPSGLLKGRTESDDYPMNVGRAVIVAGVKPDYEKITELKPDLVVYDTTLYNAQDIEKIKSLGFRTYEFTAANIDDFLTELLRLGATVGAETAASEYVDRIVRARNSGTADALDPRPKVAVVLPGNGTEHMVNGTRSFLSEVIRSSGGEPVGPDADRFVNLSPELLIAQNPDRIVIAAPTDPDKEKTRAMGEQRARQILTDPRLSGIAAIKNRRVLVVDEDVLLRKGWRVDKLIETFTREFHKP